MRQSRNRGLRGVIRGAAVAGVAVLGVSSMPGCYKEGGPGWSADRHTYYSTTWRPLTLTLFDTRTGEPVWALDIPVDRKASVGFKSGSGPNEYKPDEIVWEVMTMDRGFGSRDNRQPCPPATARRLELTMRPAPEVPGQELPGSPFGEARTGEAAAAPRTGGPVVEPVVPPSATDVPKKTEERE